MKAIYIFLTALVVALMVSCFSPWKGNQAGTMTIAFASSEADGGRAAGRFALGNPGDMTFELAVSGLGETIIHTVEGAGPHTFELMSGYWTIRIRVFGDRTVHDASLFPQRVLRAIGFGSEPFQISTGEDTFVTVGMSISAEVGSDIQLESILDTLEGPGGQELGMIAMTGNFNAVMNTSRSFDRDFILASESAVTLTRRAEIANEPLFTVSGGTLTIGLPQMGGRISINCNTGTNVPLINIYSGAALLIDGSLFQGPAIWPYDRPLPPQGGGAGFTLNLADFTDRPPDIDIPGPDISLYDLQFHNAELRINVLGSEFSNVRWFLGGELIANGTNIALDFSSLNQAGTHRLTVIADVSVNGIQTPFSRIISIEVTP